MSCKAALAVCRSRSSTSSFASEREYRRPLRRAAAAHLGRKLIKGLNRHRRQFGNETRRIELEIAGQNAASREEERSAVGFSL